MKFAFLKQGIKTTLRRALAVITLSSGAITWFYLLQAFLLEKMFESVGGTSWLHYGEAIFFLCTALSAIVGSQISERTNRRKLLWLWIASGTLAIGSIGVFHGPESYLAVTVLLGVSFGIRVSIVFGIPCRLHK